MPGTGWSWVMPHSVLDLARAWTTPSSWSDKAQDLWPIIIAAICWGIWIERNSRLLAGHESSEISVLNSIRGMILSWSSLLDSCKQLKYEELVYNWNDIFCNNGFDH